jgi:hypothetical protein
MAVVADRSIMYRYLCNGQFSCGFAPKVSNSVSVINNLTLPDLHNLVRCSCSFS